MMGRSFSSVRQELKRVAERWERTSQHMEEDARAAGKQLTGWACRHASEAFFGCNGPAEAVLFSVLVEVQRRREQAGTTGEGMAVRDGDVDP
jgi:hypothetical protein